MSTYQAKLATGFSLLSIVFLFGALLYPMVATEGNAALGYVALSSLFVAQILISTVFRSTAPAFLQRDIERFTPDTTQKTILISLIVLAFMVQSAVFAIAGASVASTPSTASTIVTATSGVIVFSYLGLYISKGKVKE